MSSASWLSRVFCCKSCQKSQNSAGNQHGLSSATDLSAEMSNKVEKIEIVDSEELVVHTLLQFVEEKSKVAIAERDRFIIGLSGIARV